MAAPAAFSFLGMSPRTTEIAQLVIGIAQEEFPDEIIQDLGDPLSLWGPDFRIGEREKKSFSPLPRLAFRGGLLLDHLEKVTVPQVQSSGATMGFFRRLGADTYIGATAYAEDPRALALWEAFVEHGVKALGLTPPLYLHTDGDDVLERRVAEYCLLPGQRYVRIEPSNDNEKMAWQVFGKVCEERTRLSQAA